MEQVHTNRCSVDASHDSGEGLPGVTGVSHADPGDHRYHQQSLG